MSRVALWRANSDDPQRFIGWILADERRQGLTPGVAALLSVGIALIGFLWWGTLSGPTPWVLLPLILIGTVLLNVQRSPRPRDVSTWITSPPPGPAFDCRIEIRAEAGRFGEGLLTGADEGIVTFVDGWLHYAGRRTEFAIRRSDAPRVDSNGRRHLFFLEDGRVLIVEVRDERDTEFADRTFRSWQARLPIPSGESILPPSAVHPTGLARAWRQVLATVAVVLLMAGILFAFSANFMMFFFVGGAWANFRRLAKLHRLARQERPALLEGTRSA